LLPPVLIILLPQALNVCIALVEPLPPSPAEQQAAAAQGLGLGTLPVPSIDAAAAEVHAAMRAQATQCISKSIDKLVALLEVGDADRELPTSYGLLRPPVGLARLKAVELLAALLHSADELAGVLCVPVRTNWGAIDGWGLLFFGFDGSSGAHCQKQVATGPHMAAMFHSLTSSLPVTKLACPPAGHCLVVCRLEAHTLVPLLRCCPSSLQRVP